MTSIIAFLIALTFGTTNVYMSDYQNIIEKEQIQKTSKGDDGVGINGEGGQVIDDPKLP